MKKTAVMIYRAFCMQEISCLTDWLVGLGKPMIVCAADHQNGRRLYRAARIQL